MSVWNEVCYTIDPLASLLRHIYPTDIYHPVLHQFCKDSYVWNDCVGDALPEGNLVDSIQKSPRVAYTLEPQAFSRKKMNADAVLDFLHEGKVYVGETAVARLVVMTELRKIRWANEWNWKWLKAFVASMLRCNQYASYQSPKDANEWIEQWLARSECNRRMQAFDNMAETYNHLQFAFNVASYKDKARMAERMGEIPPPLPKRVLDLGKEWEARRFGDMTILTYKQLLQDAHYVLLPKDLRRCAQMCSSLGDMELYFSSYGHNRGGDAIYGGYRETLRRIVSAMCMGTRVGEIPRACDVAAALLLSHVATDVWDQAVIDQEAKIAKEDLTPVLDVRALCQHFLSFPLAEAVELSKVYKFLAVPDFDFLTLFSVQKDKHYDVRPCFYDNDLGLEEWEFRCYQRHQLIISYHARHGVCPGQVRGEAEAKPWHQHYPHMNPGGIPYLDSNDVEFTHAFQYQKITRHDNPFIKDKALAPNFISGIDTEPELRGRPPEDTNYLLHMLLSSSLATPENVALGASEEPFEVGHTTAPKPETKKKFVVRNFYMNNYPGRVLISEIDNNIAEYVRQKPGAFSGLSRAEAFNKFQDMGGTELERAQNTYVFVSFDLAAWSPRQNPRLRELQLAKWAEAFHLPYIRNANSQFTDGHVHFIHKGIHQKYKLQGNDLEGYVGRLNTDLHVDIMGYAVRKLRETGTLPAGAKLAVQIDDGLCVLRFPPNTENPEIIRAVRFIEQVYAWFSLEISWDKTYVSRRLRVFLNELEYDQIRITPGVKAFLRIRRERSEGIRCFLREVNKASGQIGGAIESGTPATLAWLKFAIEAGKAILDWSRRHPDTMTPEEAALWMFIPVSYGGPGALSMLQFASNCTDDATSTGISILKSIATYDRNAVGPINRFINRPIRVRDPVSTLRDPMKFRIEGATLSDMLEVTYAKEALRDRVVNPVVYEALLFSDILSTKLRNEPLPSLLGTRGKALQLAYQATAFSSLDGILMKFARSSTVIQLIGSRQALTIFLRYKAQFRNTYSSAISIFRGY